MVGDTVMQGFAGGIPDVANQALSPPIAGSNAARSLQGFNTR